MDGMGHCDNFVALEGRRTMFVAFWTKTGQLVTAHPKTIVLQRVRRQMGDHQGHSASRDQEVSSPQPNPPAMAIQMRPKCVGSGSFYLPKLAKKTIDGINP